MEHVLQAGSCQYFLRYLLFAIMVSPKRRQMLRDARLAALLAATVGCVDGVELRDHTDAIHAIPDPLCQLMARMLLQFDFGACADLLAACEHALLEDAFLARHVAAFMDGVRCTVLELYCQLHNKIELTYVAPRGIRVTLIYP